MRPEGIEPPLQESESISLSESHAASESVAASIANTTTQEAPASIDTTTEDNNNTTVYVVDNGTTKVYWYSASAIKPTPKNPVISMTESQALAQGLHHSERE